MQPQNTGHRIYRIVKCSVFVLVGVALTLYIEWRGIELAELSLIASQWSNLPSAKQICNGEVSMSCKSDRVFVAYASYRNLSADDRRWCADAEINPPLSSIMGSTASNLSAAYKSLEAKIVATLCGSSCLDQGGVDA
jgi:hypothetical protein